MSARVRMRLGRLFGHVVSLEHRLLVQRSTADARETELISVLSCLLVALLQSHMEARSAPIMREQV